jgi:exodeoxyribonuclease VII large subunit
MCGQINSGKMGLKERLTLAQLQEQVRESVEGRLDGKYWVRAEISEIKNHPAGHCYLDLVDKPSPSEPVVARAQAIIWATSYRIIRPYFETSTGSSLAKGMHILVYVQVQYSPLYGLSLIVQDIDPAYTAGEQELERQRTIRRIREEGMLSLNGSLELPALPYRLAVISSETAAGYRDFMKHLHQNAYGFRFRTELFPAMMQGENAVETIIGAMEAVALRSGEFDLLLLLRGGGSSQDLSCFDDYELCINIAQFPLPVITGIGHEQDLHIADMVAHTSVKTPTALADFIIEIFAGEEQQISYLSQMVKQALNRRITNERNRLSGFATEIRAGYLALLASHRHALDLLEQRIFSNNAEALLGKGYALLFKDGARVRDISDVNTGDTLKVILRGGKLICTVNKKENEKE